MIRRPPRSTRTDTLFPYTTLFRADLSQVRLYYVIDGPAGAPVLVLSNSLGTCADMWARQVPALSRHFRVLRYDTRGHGQSSVPAGEYSFPQLARHLAGLLHPLAIAARQSVVAVKGVSGTV